MIDIDKWQEIISSLRRHKLRTALTAFGVFWGIFMLVLLLGFGTGFGKKVDSVFGDRKNVIYLWSSSSTQIAYQGLSKGRKVLLNQEDISAIHQKFPQLVLADGQNQMTGAQNIVHEKANGSFFVVGTHANWNKLDNNAISLGRYINAFDEKEFKKVAVIGERIKNILFKNERNPIGKSIVISGVPFQVVGVYFTVEPESEDTEINNLVFIPNSSLQRAFNQTDRHTWLTVSPAANTSAEETEKKIKQLLHERKKIHPDDAGVIGSFNNEINYREQKNLVSGVIAFSWVVAIGTLIAGALGVGNIMLVIVKERTREIGLRKSLGATPAKIITMILQESLAITLVAGYAGLVVGVGVLELVKIILVKMGQGTGMFASPYVDLNIALLALAVLVICGALASILPAMKAAAVNPVIALQDE